MFEAFKVLNIQVFFISALLFFIGYALAPTAYYKKIGWLTVYPFFIIKLMDKYFKNTWHPLKIFLVIFALNSISLFFNLLSGWGVILPVFFILYMGINIGVVIYHSLEGKFYYTSLLNPVSLLELPAAWISITMAIQFSLTKYFGATHFEPITFARYSELFVLTVLPILFVAGIAETILIMIGRNENGENSD